jgi:ribosomal protein L32
VVKTRAIDGRSKICKEEQEGVSELRHRCTEYCATVGEVDEVMAVTDEKASQSQQDMRFAIAFEPINVA